MRKAARLCAGAIAAVPPPPRKGGVKIALWPYHTSAAGLHSKMLLVNGLKCSQGKSATFLRNFGRCVGSRGPLERAALCEGLSGCPCLQAAVF